MSESITLTGESLLRAVQGQVRIQAKNTHHLLYEPVDKEKKPAMENVSRIVHMIEYETDTLVILQAIHKAVLRLGTT